MPFAFYRLNIDVNINLKFCWAIFLCVALIACSSQVKKPVNEDPSERINALVSSALAYTLRGSLDLAEKNILQALAIDSENVDANNIAGLVYAKSNRPELATQHFQKALAKSPNDSSTLNNYGNFLCDSGKLNQAEQIFLRAAKHSSNRNPEIAYTNAGLCVMRIPNPEQAAQYFRTALDFNENNSIALFQLAQINFAKNRGVPALERLQSYAQYAQHTPQTLKLGIEIGRLLKDKQTEVIYFNLLQANFPSSEEFQWAAATIGN